MEVTMDSASLRVRSRKEVCDLLGLSASTLQRLERDGTFPSPVQLSQRRVGWTEDALREFIKARST